MHIMCNERARLLGLYNQATLAISTTLEDLLHGPRSASSVMYEIRRHATEKARIAFERAGLAYASHVEEHHCESTQSNLPIR